MRNALTKILAKNLTTPVVSVKVNIENVDDPIAFLGNYNHTGLCVVDSPFGIRNNATKPLRVFGDIIIRGKENV